MNLNNVEHMNAGPLKEIAEPTAAEIYEVKLSFEELLEKIDSLKNELIALEKKTDIDSLERTKTISNALDNLLMRNYK